MDMLQGLPGASYDLGDINTISIAVDTKFDQCPMPFGRAVMYSSESHRRSDTDQIGHLPDGEGKILSIDGVPFSEPSISTVFAGIHHRTASAGQHPPLVEPAGFGDTCYKVAGECMSVATRGKIYALVDEDVSDRQIVYVRTRITAPGQIIGAFTATNDSPNTIRFRPHAKSTFYFYAGASAGNLAIVDME